MSYRQAVIPYLIGDTSIDFVHFAAAAVTVNPAQSLVAHEQIRPSL
jgi:hypothetical protein